MKFAIAIAFFVLGQCLVADAWYVTCSRFNSYCHESQRDRSSLWSHVHSLERTRNSHSNDISYVNRQTNYLHSEFKKQHGVASSLRSSAYSVNNNAASLRSRVDGQAKRISKLETISNCAYSDDLLMCLIAQFIDA